MKSKNGLPGKDTYLSGAQQRGMFNSASSAGTAHWGAGQDPRILVFLDFPVLKCLRMGAPVWTNPWAQCQSTALCLHRLLLLDWRKLLCGKVGTRYQIVLYIQLYFH